MPENEPIVAYDQIRGFIHVNTATLDDKILWKSSDGLPTYHLANIVDDHLMEISHVIRGEEWLPSLPLHILLYKFLGWENTMPKFAHLPLLLKPDGKGKLSKRDGDKLGFPVFPLQWSDPQTGEITMGYRELGYLPQAFVNILAFLGWNPGTEQELFTLDELIQAFSLEHVGKSGAKFDFEKAKWFNHQYLQLLTDAQVATLFLPILKQQGLESNTDYLTKVCGLLKERVNFPKEIWDQGHFFFTAPQKYDTDIVNKRWNPQTPAILMELMVVVDQIEDFSAEHINDVIHQFATNKNLTLGQVMIPLRIALVGSGIGPDLHLIISLLGKGEVISRIKTTLNKIHIK